MNQIEIKYSYFSNKADVTINGEKISLYSELSTVLNRPYLESFTHIITGLDKEIFDEYEIDFWGSLFQYRLLSSISDISEFCKGIHFHKMEFLYAQDKLLERLSEISEQNNIVVEKPDGIAVYNHADISVPQINGIQFVGDQGADIGIFTDVNEISPAIHIPVVIAENLSCKQIGGRTYYSVPFNELPDFWDYVILEYITRPLIAEYVTALQYARLTSLQKTELDSIKNNRPSYFIGEIPDSLDKGTSFPIEFASFPVGAFKLSSENPRIVSCSVDSITAIEGGNTFVLITNDKNEIAAQKQISVISHQYVEEIRLIPRFEYLKRSERNRIDVILTPLNAEDANRLTWVISDPNIIQVDESGNIIALEHGKTTITVSGYATSASLTVEVKPTLQNLRFSQPSVRLKLGQTIILECDVTPSDAPTENLTWELDNKSIASINPSKTGKRCQVIASTSYEGKGNVRCYDSTTKLGAICNIEVISKVKSSIAGKIALWCWLIGIIWPFLLPVSTIAGAYGLICDQEPDRRTRYIVCTVGSIVTLLFRLMLTMS